MINAPKCSERGCAWPVEGEGLCHWHLRDLEEWRSAFRPISQDRSFEEIKRRPRVPRETAKRTIIEKIKAVAVSLGRTPTQRELSSAGVWPSSVCYLFGTQSNALIEAGITPRIRGQHRREQ